ncbi:hypothetical protein SY88_04055 [Clostridiales bacterium PH28_bin88]|nr:hypothetical protein SY88_04055 [Clostridiales bacterium PH28_bin88]
MPWLTDEEIQRMVDKVSGRGTPRVSRARFAPLEPVAGPSNQMPLAALGDVKVELSARLGDASLTVREVLDLQVGSVIELDRLAGEPVEILVNDHPLVLGEVVVINEVFGIRVNSLAGEREG